jgi:hypothetical protein
MLHVDGNQTDMKIMKQTLGNNNIMFPLINMQKIMDGGKLVRMIIVDGIGDGNRGSNMVAACITSIKEEMLGMEIEQRGMATIERKKTTCHGLRSLDFITTLMIIRRRTLDIIIAPMIIRRMEEEKEMEEKVEVEEGGTILVMQTR